ncbi:hypothetical protein [Actinospica robiniae]|uniref:hypothetical protein n=1 Tax=Actinospica robiniae TaxID=304901 RepID=UPI00041EFC78|nr:hypothetical protein [Actinospica robiniae]
MPITKSGMRNKVIETLSQVAPPGEQFVACVHGMTGPSPWLDTVIGSIGATIMQAFRKYYFVTVTNTSVVVNRAGRIAANPKEIVAVVPLASGAIEKVQKGAVWGKLYVRFPGEAKATKINIGRIWNKDLDVLAGAAAPFAQVPTEVAAQQ